MVASNSKGQLSAAPLPRSQQAANTTFVGRKYYRLATWAFIGVAVVYSILLRLYVSWGLPLWLDESWTAVLSSAPTFRSFSDQMWLDTNAPLYYFLIWLWPFESNFGLKLPSLIFGMSAGLVAMLWRPNGLSRGAALFWGALLLLWLPGFSLFVDARYYALLFLISTGQAIAFAKLMEKATLSRACWWAGLSSLAILTHYYAAIPAAIQGLVYLGRHRDWKGWPALLLFSPALAWGIFHWPRLAQHSARAWYEFVTVRSAEWLLLWPLAVTTLAAAGLIVLVLAFRRRPELGIALTAIAGVTALFAMVALGMVWPIMADRYLIPVVPPILMGVAASVRPAGYLPIAAWLVLHLGSPTKFVDGLRQRAVFGLEFTARLLPNASRVTWWMDTPGAKLFDRNQQEAMLLDAFKRNGRTIEPRWGEDVTAGDGLIWFYSVKSAASVERIKSKWRCADYQGLSSTLVCWNPQPRI